MFFNTIKQIINQLFCKHTFHVTGNRFAGIDCDYSLKVIPLTAILFTCKRCGKEAYTIGAFEQYFLKYNYDYSKKHGADNWPIDPETGERAFRFRRSFKFKGKEIKEKELIKMIEGE